MATPENVSPLTSNDDAEIKRRINQAEEERRRFEPQWLVNLAFVAGEQWVGVSRFTRQLAHLSELDPRYEDVDLYVADIIHEHRGAALGELTTDSDRPQLVLPGDGEADEEAELVQEQANRVVGYAWNYEINADVKLGIARQYAVDLGVAAIRVRYDRTKGEAVKSSEGEPVDAPVDPVSGELIVQPDQAREYVAGMAERGETARFAPLKNGRIVWDAGSAFNLLTPPGVPHESKFAWECWVEPVLLSEVKAMYPAARDMKPDTDIGSALGITVSQQGGKTGTPRVADSVWLYHYYERPSAKHPNGRVNVYGGAQKRRLETKPQLPHLTPVGDYDSGIVYLHWQRLSDRFWSRSLIDALKDPQRMTNRTATQQQEIIDRGMPSKFVEEGSLPNKPAGTPGEYIEVKKGAAQPMMNPGNGPGAWMQDHRNQLLQDAQHASTIGALRLGENPSQVTTYSQLRLLFETEGQKRSAIRVDHQTQIGHLTELVVECARRYWPEGKHLIVAGPANRLQAVTFERSMLPDGVVVEAAKGTPKPRGEAERIQLIADLWTAALNSGAATQNAGAWMDWLADSYEAGMPLPLPQQQTDVWADKAELENTMLRRGEQVAVAPYDPPLVHIPRHRRAQDEAIMAGDVNAYLALEEHVKEHEAVEQAKLVVHGPPAVPPTAAGVMPAGEQTGPVTPASQPGDTGSMAGAPIQAQ